MGQLISLTAVILSTTNVGDFDKRLVLLTKERGKISAFAKGARRPNSILMAVCQPFSFGKFSLYEGRSSYNLSQADITNYFTELRSDLEGIYLGMYFCEFADYMTSENNDESSILKLLYQSLRALTIESIPNSLIRYIYEIKIMAYYGQAMQTFACMSCGKTEGNFIFSSHAGGVLCDNCSRDVHGKIKISQSTLYTLQYIISSTIEKLYTFNVSPQVLKELKLVSDQYRQEYVNKTFKTLDFI